MTTYTSQPDETTGIDSHINSDTATTNYGTDTSIDIGERNDAVSTRRGLYKNTLAGIPANAIVSSAVLSLYVVEDKSDNARTLRVFRLKRIWTEAGVTWNKYDGASDWQTAGGFGANDCEATDIGSASIAASPANGTEYQIALTAAKVQEWISGAFTNNGLLLKVDTESSDCIGYGSSGNTTAGYRPKLVITYTQPAAFAVCIY